MYAINTTGLTKRYPETVAVTDLDLQVQAGEVYGFVGPNGAGKSTTIAMLLALCTPSAGRIRVLGQSPRADQMTLRKRVGVLPESGGLFDRLSARDHLRFLVRTHEAAESPKSLLHRVGLEGEGHRAVRGFSTGMAQRLRLAMALVGTPDLLILDEPAAGLDPAGIERLRRIVERERERGAAVFFSSHALADVAAVSDRVGFLVDGRLRAVVAADGREALAAQFENLVGGSR